MTASQAGLGLAVVVDDGEIKGIITDGDLRRALFNHDSLDGLTAESVMTRSPMLINENEMFADAENIMLKASITSLLVVSEQGALSGVLKLQDAGRVVY